MDVVGYSALMERAEEATYAEVERLTAESASAVNIDDAARQTTKNRPRRGDN